MIALEVGSTWIRGARAGAQPTYAEPTLLARDVNSLTVLARGRQAADLQWGAPGNVQFVRPVQAGQIVDWEGALTLVRDALAQLHTGRQRPSLALAVPARLSLVGRRAWKQLATQAGAAAVQLVEVPLCAAAGCGCDPSRPEGRLVVDWGGGALDLGLVSGGALLAAESTPWGGLELDQAIQRCVRQQHGLLISLNQAEQIKLELAQALPTRESAEREVTGFGAVDGLPRAVSLSGRHLQAAVEPFLARLRDSLLGLLAQASPELCADILREGLWLCGGAAQLRDLPFFLEQISGLRVLTVESPQEATIRGLADWIRSRN